MRSLIGGHGWVEIVAATQSQLRLGWGARVEPMWRTQTKEVNNEDAAKQHLNWRTSRSVWGEFSITPGDRTGVLISAAPPAMVAALSFA